MINSENLEVEISSLENLDGEVSTKNSIDGEVNNSTGGTILVTDYNVLSNKPKINGEELKGNKTTKDLGITAETIEFTDGETFQEKYDNGELKGEKGETGATGPQGIQGIQGPAGKDGTNGTNGTNGKDGKDGTNGTDGHTPVKGVDYYTDADKQEMVELVLDALPSSEGVSY